MQPIKILRKLALLIGLLEICSFSPFVFGEGEDIYFAGVAFTGNALDTSSVLPYTSEILSAESQALLNRQFHQSLLEKPPQNLTIVFDRLANLDDGSSALVLAATIDRETVIVDKIGDVYKILVEVAGQAIFFDFRERQIISSYPVTVQYIDARETEPSSDDISKIFESILFGLGESSFIPLITKKMETVTLPQAAARRIRVSAVEVSESVKSNYSLLNQTLFDTGVIGHEFSKILSDELNLSILPFQSGQALGGTMAARFANGDIYNLTIPEPDYEIRLYIEDFKGRTLNETPAFRQELFGAYFRISVTEPLSGRSFFDRNLKQGATKVIPSTQADFDADQAYYETLLVGLSGFSASSANEKENWITQQDEPRKLKREFASLQELIELCR